MKTNSKLFYSQMAEYYKKAYYTGNVRDYLRVTLISSDVPLPDGNFGDGMSVCIVKIECMVEGKAVKLPSMTKNIGIVEAETETQRNKVLRSAIGLFDGLMKEWDNQYRVAPEKRDIQVY